jgi:DNA-binding beta-propeller fold protein YncE
MITRLNANQHTRYRAIVIILFIALIVLASRQLRADTGSCGGATTTLPFTDVPSSNSFFCAIASAYFSGLTNGTSATTYTPNSAVPREQMAAFITRTHDSAIRRSNRRAVAQQWWRPKVIYRPYVVGGAQDKIAWDGEDLWVASTAVYRRRASDGILREIYHPVGTPYDVIVALGYVFVTSLEGMGTPGKVYRIDPQKTNDDIGAVELFADNTGPNPTGITFDGQFLWTANNAGGLIGGSITRITLDGAETTFTAGFTALSDVLWDGENLWVADFAADRVRRVDPATGAVLQSIAVGSRPRELLFDGTNLWVTNGLSDSLTVIRAVGGLRGTVLATITGNGLDAPRGLAFDGENILVTNNVDDGSVSLFKAADFTPLGNFTFGGAQFPNFACSDGINFWITLQGEHYMMRF